jgi:DNA-binding SARP family transcriptional activator
VAITGFEAWVGRRRSHLEQFHRELCRRLVDARVAAGDGEGALTVARRWAEAEPLDDEAVGDFTLHVLTTFDRGAGLPAGRTVAAQRVD